MEIKKEQQDIINHNEGNIIVSASAGSGKTFVMIQRLIRLIVQKKADISEILTVTFTDASARDMKEKLKKALIKEINSNTISQEDKERLLEQLNDIPLSDISTIDSFCLRLLKQYFYVVGISHDFSIASDDDQITLKNLAIKNLFDNYYEKKDTDFLSLLDKYREGRNDEKLREMIIKAYEFIETEEDPIGFLAKIINTFSDESLKEIEKQYLDIVKQNILTYITRIKMVMKYVNEKKFPKMYSKLSETVDNLNKYSDFSDIYSLCYEKSIKLPQLRYSDDEKDHIEPFVEKVKEIKNDLNDYIKKTVSKYVGTQLETKKDIESAKETAVVFIGVLEEFYNEYHRNKKEENILDFTDLERYALKVLDTPEILATLHAKYKYVCIDEYQDVNGLQESLFKKISDNNMFMVGDVKQSIYGFRGCRPEIFDDKFSLMSSNGEKATTLNYNFRSAENVIGFINEVFSYSMTENIYGLDYHGKAKLQYGGRYDNAYKGEANIYMLKTEHKDKIKEQPRIYDIKNEIDIIEEDEENVASLIKKIIESKLGQEYYDPDEEKAKRITYKDIAILLRDKKGKYANKISLGLKNRGVPVASGVKTSVLSFSEVEMLVGILKYIDNARQDIPLVSALKSPLFAIENSELLEIKHFYRTKDDSHSKDNFFLAYRYYLQNADTPLNNRLKEFESKIERYRFLSGYSSTHNLLSMILEENNYESFYLSTANGEDKVNRIRFFVSVANTNGKELSLNEFLKMIDNRSDLFVYNEGAEGDAVSIATIHSSKGLEYPVVIVCGLEQAIKKTDDKEQILSSREYGFIPKSFDLDKRTTKENIIRGLIKEKNNITRIKEELRLFYVALTRAKYSLNLVFEGEEDERGEVFLGAKSFLDYVPKNMNVIYEDKESLALYNQKHKINQVIFVPDANNTDKSLAEKIKNAINYRYPFEKDTVLPLKSSVTGIAENGVFSFDADAVFEGGISNTEVGKTAHKFMEYLDFTRLNECKVQAEEMIRNGIMTENEINSIDIDKIQNAVIKADLKAVVGKDIYKEKNFLYLVPAKDVFFDGGNEEVLIQGIIDLLAIDNDSAVIIDYKYSGVDRTTLQNRYQKQLQIYADAVEKILDKKHYWFSSRIYFNITWFYHFAFNEK